MFCPKCENEFPDSASFCPNCGHQKPKIPQQKQNKVPEITHPIEQSTVKHNRPIADTGFKHQQGKKKSRLFIGVGIVAVVVVIIGAVVLASFFGEDEATAALSTVQNGYLGEYTDMTVEELLDTYYELFYEQSTWDSGVTDDGKILVQVEYSGSSMDSTTIQFSMLDEMCFEVTAFVSPTEEIEEATDMLAALNKIYITTYETKKAKDTGNGSIADIEAELLDRLSTVYASEVRYGASQDYTGDRAQLCQLFGDERLEMTVPELLQVYGILNSGIEVSGNSENQVSIPQNVSDELSNPDDVPNDLNACAVLDIDAGSYDTNYAWLEAHLGQWVKLVGLYVDSRMTDYQYSPVSYCLMYNQDEYGPRSYGDFAVTGPDNSMLIPLADGMSDTYYVFLDRDSYGGIVGINAFAENMNQLSSDPVFDETEYLFPSDSQYITDADLAQFTKDEIVLLRNEIYARHGYVFSDPKISAYFASQSWYLPIEGVNASTFDSSVFNNYEQTNLDTILAYERTMGWRQ